MKKTIKKKTTKEEKTFKIFSIFFCIYSCLLVTCVYSYIYNWKGLLFFSSALFGIFYFVLALMFIKALEDKKK